MSAGRSTLEVGRITKAHGLRGQVIVDLVSDRTERLNPGVVLLTDRGELVVESSARHQDKYIVKFDRINSRDESEAWRGVLLSAERIEDDSVIWIDQLYQAHVVDQQGTDYGVVVDVEANPASDLMVLESGALVPLTFVVSVDPNNVVTIDAPEGLFE